MKTKWTIEEYEWSNPKTISFRFGHYWIVPFARVWANGEPTPFCLSLEYPDLDNEIYKELQAVPPLEIRIVISGNNLADTHTFYAAACRPEITEVINQCLGAYSQNLARITWSLEKQNDPASKIYQQIREHAARWRVLP